MPTVKFPFYFIREAEKIFSPCDVYTWGEIYCQFVIIRRHGWSKSCMYVFHFTKVQKNCKSQLPFSVLIKYLTIIKCPGYIDNVWNWINAKSEISNAKRAGYIRFPIVGNVGVRKSKLLSALSNFLFLCKC